jgi:hypothetical protein
MFLKARRELGENILSNMIVLKTLKTTAILIIIDARYQLSTVFSTSLLLENSCEIMIRSVNYYENGSMCQLSMVFSTSLLQENR